MIICSCNVITDRDVRRSAKPCGASADRARDVFRSRGCLPKCGRCVRNIQAFIDREMPPETDPVRSWLSSPPPELAAAE